MASPEQTVHAVQKEAADLLRIYYQHHGWYRGTHVAVLAEAQGVVMIVSRGAGTIVSHQTNLANDMNALRNCRDAISSSIGKTGKTDPHAAGAVSQVFKPVQEFATAQLEIAQGTIDLARELQLAGHQKRLAGTPIQTGERDIGALVSTQLSNLGLSLIPSGIAETAWVRQTLAQIERLPLEATGAILLASAPATAAAAVARQLVISATRGRTPRTGGSSTIAAGVTSQLVMNLDAAAAALLEVVSMHNVSR